MSDTLAVVQIDNGFVLDSVDLVDNGSYALVPVASGATVTARKMWYCGGFKDIVDAPRPICAYAAEHRLRCGWVTVVAET